MVASLDDGSVTNDTSGTYIIVPGAPAFQFQMWDQFVLRTLGRRRSPKTVRAKFKRAAR
jgi:hypothetical protein